MTSSCVTPDGSPSSNKIRKLDKTPSSPTLSPDNVAGGDLPSSPPVPSPTALSTPLPSEHFFESDLGLALSSPFTLSPSPSYRPIKRNDVGDAMNVPSLATHSPQSQDHGDISLAEANEKVGTLHKQRAALEADVEASRLKQEVERIRERNGLDSPQSGGTFVSAENTERRPEFDHDLDTDECSGRPLHRDSNRDADLGVAISASMSQQTGSKQVGSPKFSPPLSGKQVRFADSLAENETPSEKTMKYFRDCKGKENSAMKSRRRTMLPEEISSAVHEAQGGDEEDEGLEDLDKYREYDLAPMDPIMENDFAGDLIMLSTPVKQKSNQDVLVEGTRTLRLSPLGDSSKVNAAVSSTLIDLSETPNKPSVSRLIDLSDADWSVLTPQKVEKQGKEKKYEVQSVSTSRVILEDISCNIEGVAYELEIPGHYNDACKIEVRTNAQPEQIAEYIRARAKELDANDNVTDKAVKNFLDYPDSYRIDNKNVAAQSQEDPAFVKVIGMLPATVFWTMAGTAAQCANFAYASLVDKLRNW